MAGVGDVVRRMDYLKRAKNTLGMKKVYKSTTLQENSSFVKSANEHQSDRLQVAMRKMEADQKLFRDGHTKELCTVKRFHNTVHTKSTDFNDFSLNDALPAGPDSRKTDTKKTPESIFSRRGSLNFSVTTNPAANQKRRHSVQVDSSKYGRSFRKLKDAITPAPKARISPEPVPKAGFKSVRGNASLDLVTEARRS